MKTTRTKKTVIKSAIATALVVVALISSLSLFAMSDENTDMQDVKLAEPTTETVELTETTAENSDGDEQSQEISKEIENAVKKLSVNNAKVYSVEALTAPHELGTDDEAERAAENDAKQAEKEISAEETVDIIIVGDEATTAPAKANAKYVVSEDNDLVKKVISCGYPNKNFGLSEKDAKSITYAAIQYLCDGKEYTGTYQNEFNEAGTKADGGTYDVVTFECSPEQVQKLLEASDHGMHLGYICHGNDERAQGLLNAQQDLNASIVADS